MPGQYMRVGVLFREFINQFMSNTCDLFLHDFQIFEFCHFHKLLYSLKKLYR